MSNIRFSDMFNREALRAIKTSTTKALTDAPGTTNVLSVSERGVLKSVGFHITTAVTGSPVITLRVQIDGGTVMDMLLWNGSLEAHPDSGAYIMNLEGTTSGMAVDGISWLMDLDLPYNVSCLVAIIIGTSASAGVFDVAVIRKVPV